MKESAEEFAKRVVEKLDDREVFDNPLNIKLFMDGEMGTILCDKQGCHARQMVENPGCQYVLEYELVAVWSQEPIPRMVEQIRRKES